MKKSNAEMASIIKDVAREAAFGKHGEGELRAIGQFLWDCAGDGEFDNNPGLAISILDQFKEAANNLQRDILERCHAT